MALVSRQASLKKLRTRDRLRERALVLFESQGYEQTTIEQIAAAAGVSHMTFFRAFPTKASVLRSPPDDTLLASAAASAPSEPSLLGQACWAFRYVYLSLDEWKKLELMRMTRIGAGVPELPGTIVASDENLIRKAADVFVGRGFDRVSARAAVACVYMAFGEALTAWALEGDPPSLDAAVALAIEVVGGPLGDGILSAQAPVARGSNSPLPPQAAMRSGRE